jgi:AcrR family transcriptional regulator
LATKRAYHHGNLREALIAAALKEVARSGPEAFSLRSVARRAGVSPPAVYRHFADKDALLAAVAVDCSERISAAMRDAVANAPDDPLERFRATGIAYVQFAVEHPEHFRAMSSPGLAAHTPQLQRLRFEARDREERESLVRAQQAGKIAAVPIEELMLAASSIVHGLAQLIVEGRLGDVDVAAARRFALSVTAVLGAGLTPRAEAYDDPRGVLTLPATRKKRGTS